MADKKSRKRSSSNDEEAKPPKYLPASPRKPVKALLILSVALFLCWLGFLVYVAFLSR